MELAGVESAVVEPPSYGKASASAAADAAAPPAPSYARAPAYAPTPASVPERGTIDAGDRVRLANFLSTGQGLDQ